MDVNVIKSVWDGWEKQITNRRYDNDGGNCALGFVDRSISNKGYRDVLMKPTYDRIAAHIEQNYDMSGFYERNWEAIAELCPRSAWVIAYANNELKLTPEQFREIDRLTQIEAITKPLIDSATHTTQATTNDDELVLA